MQQEYSGKGKNLKERLEGIYQNMPIPMLIIRKRSFRELYECSFEQMKYTMFPTPKYSVKLVRIKDFSEEHRKNKEARDYFRGVAFARWEEEYARQCGGPYPLQSFEVRKIMEKFKNIRKEGEQKKQGANSDITDKLDA